jgi:hypothetical protein
VFGKGRQFMLLIRDRPFNFQVGVMVFSKKNIPIPNVAEKFWWREKKII